MYPVAIFSFALFENHLLHMSNDVKQTDGDQKTFSSYGCLEQSRRKNDKNIKRKNHQISLFFFFLDSSFSSIHFLFFCSAHKNRDNLLLRYGNLCVCIFQRFFFLLSALISQLVKLIIRQQISNKELQVKVSRRKENSMRDSKRILRPKNNNFFRETC